MSLQYGKLCSLILLEFFGETVEKIGRDLYRAGQKPLRIISASAGLSVEEVRQSLCILIKYGLVSFSPGKTPSIPEYKFHPDKVLTLLRYPKYLMLMKTLYGDEAECIVEEILKHGVSSMPGILLGCHRRITAENELEKKKTITIQSLRDTFELLVNKQYLKRCSVVMEKNVVPEFVNDPETQFQPVKVDMRELIQALSDDSVTFNDPVLWEINVDRFHQDMRDDLLVSAMGRRFPPRGGEVMHLVLRQMQLCSDPWASVSNPVFLSDLKDKCRITKADPLTVKYLEELLSVMAGEVDSFLARADSSSIAYHVHLKNAVEELTWCLLANTVDARYGPNAARIFRLIREQKFIEQEEIQKRAMLPDKEAKYLTYSMLQSGWIQQHELKKSLQKANPTKTFFLFCIDIDQVVRMYMEICFKSLYNAIIRREHEKTENKCLLDKKQRIDAIALHMRKEGATDEQVAEILTIEDSDLQSETFLLTATSLLQCLFLLQIEEMITPPEVVLLETIHQKLSKLSLAELQIDETLFLLELFLRVQNSP